MAVRPQSSKCGTRKEKGKQGHDTRVASASRIGTKGQSWNSGLSLTGSQVALNNRDSSQRSDAWTTAGSLYMEDMRESYQRRNLTPDLRSDRGQPTAFGIHSSTTNSSYSSLWSGEEIKFDPSIKSNAAIYHLQNRSTSFVSSNGNSVSEASATFGSAETTFCSGEPSIGQISSDLTISDSRPNTSLDNNVSRSSTPASSLSLHNHASSSGSSAPRKKSRKRNKMKAVLKQTSIQSDSTVSESVQSFGKVIERQAYSTTDSLDNIKTNHETVSSDYSCLVYNVQIPHPADISGNIRPLSPVKKQAPVFEETDKLLTNLKEVLAKYPVIRISENEDSGLGSNAESSRQSPQVSRERTPTPMDESKLQDLVAFLTATSRPALHSMTESVKNGAHELGTPVTLPSFNSRCPTPVETNKHRVAPPEERAPSRCPSAPVLLSPSGKYENGGGKRSAKHKTQVSSLRDNSTPAFLRPDSNLNSEDLSVPSSYIAAGDSVIQEGKKLPNSQELETSTNCREFSQTPDSKFKDSEQRLGLTQGGDATPSKRSVTFSPLVFVGTEDGENSDEEAQLNGRERVVHEVVIEAHEIVDDKKSSKHQDFSDFLDQTLSNASGELQSVLRSSDASLETQQVTEKQPKKYPALNETFSKASFEILDDQNENPNAKRNKSADVKVGSDSQEEKPKLKEIFTFLDDIDKGNRTTLRGIHELSLDGEVKSKYSSRVLSSLTPEELGDELLALQVLLQEKDRKLSLMERELLQEQELSKRATKSAEKELRTRLSNQKTEFEATISRLQKIVDEVQQEKRDLQSKVSSLTRETENLKQKFDDYRRQTEERHSAEIKRIRASFAASQRQQQSKWLSEKTNQIKEMTVRGLEPELHRLMDQHKQELDTLRTLHRVELQRLQETLTANHASQIDSLRSQFQVEKENACAKEREAFKQRLDREAEDLERSYRERYSRLEAEITRERSRFNSEQTRLEHEYDEHTKKLYDKFEREKKLLVEEFKSELKMAESKSHIHLKSICDSLNREKDEALVRLRKSLEEKIECISSSLADAESKLRMKDKENSLMQERFSEELTKARTQLESEHQQTVKSLKEKFKNELGELEAQLEEQKSRLFELRSEVSSKEEELVSLRVSLALRTKELEEAQVVVAKYSNERNEVRKIVRSEMEEEMRLIEEERNKLRGEVSRIRSEHCVSLLEKDGEISQLRMSHEKDLRQLHERIRQAISVKDETICQLQQKLHATVARCQNLEEMVDKLQQSKLDSRK